MLSYAKRTEALRLHAEGRSCSEVAELQGISKNTVKSWVYRYTKAFPRKEKTACLNCSKELDNKPKQKPKRFCSDRCRLYHWRDNKYAHDYYDNLPNSEIDTYESDFGTIGFCKLKENAIRKIFLICGFLIFNGKIDAFAARLPKILEYNLNVGDVFVFCNRSRRQLSILQWQGQEFALMFRRTENTRYPWPDFHELRIVEITESDLKMLVEYPRFLARLSGFRSPQILI